MEPEIQAVIAERMADALKLKTHPPTYGSGNDTYTFLIHGNKAAGLHKLLEILHAEGIPTYGISLTAKMGHPAVEIPSDVVERYTDRLLSILEHTAGEIKKAAYMIPGFVTH